MDHKNSQSASYAAAGVDITAGYKAVELMKKHIARTKNEGCLDDVGGFGGYGSYQQRSYTESDSSDNYQKAAYNYIRYGRYQEALNALGNSDRHDARWYYLSALAHDGLGNQVTALEHIRRAVSMEPDNPEYLRALDEIEGGGVRYRQQAGGFRGFQIHTDPCSSLCFCYLAQLFCCRGHFFCC